MIITVKRRWPEAEKGGVPWVAYPRLPTETAGAGRLCGPCQSWPLPQLRGITDQAAMRHISVTNMHPRAKTLATQCGRALPSRRPVPTNGGDQSQSAAVKWSALKRQVG